MFQRVIAGLRMSRPSSSYESDRSQCTYLPPEVQEKIIEQIQDNQTLLTCRLVSKFWNEIASNLLEQHHLCHWTSWNPIPSSKLHILSPSIVKVFQKVRGHPHLKLPQALELHRRNHSERNPFPAKSISIVSNPCFLYNRPKVSYNFGMEWGQFFDEFGKFLTSIVLYGTHITVPQFEVMLNVSPNLKALTMYHVRILGNLDNAKKIVSPNLKYLQVFHINKMSPLILNACDHQLVSLTLVCVSLSVLRRRKFDCLKQLRIVENANKLSIRKCEALELTDLKYLSIVVSNDEEDSALFLSHFQYHAAVIKFVSQFNSSLLNLHLKVPSELLLEHSKEKEIVYSKLKTLSIQEIGAQNYLLQVREELFGNREILLSQIFPNLMCINFTSPTSQVEL